MPVADSPTMKLPATPIPSTSASQSQNHAGHSTTNNSTFNGNAVNANGSASPGTSSSSSAPLGSQVEQIFDISFQEMKGEARLFVTIIQGTERLLKEITRSNNVHNVNVEECRAAAKAAILRTQEASRLASDAFKRMQDELLQKVYLMFPDLFQPILPVTPLLRNENVEAAAAAAAEEAAARNVGVPAPIMAAPDGGNAAPVPVPVPSPIILENAQIENPVRIETDSPPAQSFLSVGTPDGGRNADAAAGENTTPIAAVGAGAESSNRPTATGSGSGRPRPLLRKKPHLPIKPIRILKAATATTESVPVPIPTPDNPITNDQSPPLELQHRSKVTDEAAAAAAGLIKVEFQTAENPTGIFNVMSGSLAISSLRRTPHELQTVDDEEPGTSTRRSTPPSKVYRRPCPKRFAQVEAVVAVEAAMAGRPDPHPQVCHFTSGSGSDNGSGSDIECLGDILDLKCDELIDQLVDTEEDSGGKRLAEAEDTDESVDIHMDIDIDMDQFDLKGCNVRLSKLPAAIEDELEERKKLVFRSIAGSSASPDGDGNSGEEEEEDRAMQRELSAAIRMLEKDDIACSNKAKANQGQKPGLGSGPKTKKRRHGNGNESNQSGLASDSDDAEEAENVLNSGQAIPILIPTVTRNSTNIEHEHEYDPLSSDESSSDDDEGELQLQDYDSLPNVTDDDEDAAAAFVLGLNSNSKKPNPVQVLIKEEQTSRRGRSPLVRNRVRARIPGVSDVMSSDSEEESQQNSQERKVSPILHSRIQSFRSTDEEAQNGNAENSDGSGSGSCDTKDPQTICSSISIESDEENVADQRNPVNKRPRPASSGDETPNPNRGLRGQSQSQPFFGKRRRPSRPSVEPEPENDESEDVTDEDAELSASSSDISDIDENAVVESDQEIIWCSVGPGAQFPRPIMTCIKTEQPEHSESEEEIMEVPYMNMNMSQSQLSQSNSPSLSRTKGRRNIKPILADHQTAPESQLVAREEAIRLEMEAQKMQQMQVDNLLKVSAVPAAAASRIPLPAPPAVAATAAAAATTPEILGAGDTATVLVLYEPGLALDVIDHSTQRPYVEVHQAISKYFKEHQREGVIFMFNRCFFSQKAAMEDDGRGCILAHCMGLGKTIQVIGLLHTVHTHHILQQKFKTTLVICPKLVVGNWKEEVSKWQRALPKPSQVKVHVLSKNNPEVRLQKLQQWRADGGIALIHYDLFLRFFLNSPTMMARIRNKGPKKVKPPPAKPRQKKVISDEELRILEECLLNPGPDILVLDEGHILKNAKTRKYKLIKQIATKRKIIMTGTPLQNNLQELFAIVEIVHPSLLGTWSEFSNRFKMPIENGQFSDSLIEDVNRMKYRTHILNKKVSGVVHRRTAAVLANDLKPKFEYTIAINLTPMQVELYNHYLKEESKFYSQTQTQHRYNLLRDYHNVAKIIAHPLMLTKLTTSEKKSRKKKTVPIDIEDVDDTWVGSEEDDELSVSVSVSRQGGGHRWFDDILSTSNVDIHDFELSGKLVILRKILEICASTGDKVLVFSQFLNTLNYVEDLLELMDKENEVELARRLSEGAAGNDGGFPRSNRVGMWKKGLDYLRLDGSTKDADREDFVKRFNHKSSQVKLFLVCTRAGNLGINLVGANRVVVFDASWNPSQDLQGIFRVYRYGQNKNCYIYRLLGRTTMEEKIYNGQVIKLALASRVVDEKQIERFIHADQIGKLYVLYQPNIPAIKDDRALQRLSGQDRLLGMLLAEYGHLIHNILEHDSLLQDDEDLTEEQRNEAHELYDREFTIPVLQEAVPGPSGNGNVAAGVPGLTPKPKQVRKKRRNKAEMLAAKGGQAGSIPPTMNSSPLDSIWATLEGQLRSGSGPGRRHYTPTQIAEIMTVAKQQFTMAVGVDKIAKDLTQPEGIRNQALQACNELRQELEDTFHFNFSFYFNNESHNQSNNSSSGYASFLGPQQ